MPTTPPPSRTYVAREAVGNCKVCHRWNDLRYGACFTCSPRVDGKALGDGLHELWEKNDPTNRWVVNERGTND